jgi:hypothetical protein
MKIIKWIGVFVVAFLLAWVLIFTFMQEPFKESVSAKILTMRTPAIPIYLYVAGSFAIGLLAGCAFAMYTYVTVQAKVHLKTKECLSLQEQLAELSRRLESSEPPEPPETSAFQTDMPQGAENPKPDSMGHIDGEKL